MEWKYKDLLYLLLYFSIYLLSILILNLLQIELNIDLYNMI